MISPVFIACIGIIESNLINPLGTAFFISEKKLVTARHVISGRSGKIVVIPSGLLNYDDYQDTTVRKFQSFFATIIEEDPVKDLCILETEQVIKGPQLNITGFDGASVGDDIDVIGYPHCGDGRIVLTLQKATVGAKVLLDSSGIKTKFAIINTQTRPGQSGSPVVSKKDNSVVGILIGAYANLSGGYVTFGNNINPSELHQTTQCISAEYIKDML
ncbi:serine protease [Pantoea sp. WMus005]|uniref:trypsin-like serine peptidase n=1 Tax=Pantoea TaxID=53335 RepID=UPI0015D0942F|nr:serine protease [Pantoea sp. WMus005]NYS28876.1 trypsin-like peptidase domain-containing protein [Pantoea sp. WMus005]